MRRRWIAAFVMIAGAFAAPHATAQEPAPPGELVDRIIAVVGDSIILRTDIDVALLQLAASGQPLPEDPAALEDLRRQVLEAEINELLLVQAALADTTIAVSEERIETYVDQTVESRSQAFGGMTALRQALRAQGRTLEDFREMLAKDQRRTLLAQQYLSKMRQTRPPPPVTAEEIREYFEANRQQLGQRPATVSFKQVVIATEPADSAESSSRAVAEDLLRQLRTGEPDSAEFARLAREYSEDPGTSEQGGDLGWFQPSRMVDAFADAVRRLRPGEISDVVESSYGFHIIKLERIRGSERRARHILIRPEISDADEARARQLADSIAGEVRSGTPIDSLIERYSDPAEQSRIAPRPRSQLPPPYNTELAAADSGDIIGPIRLSANANGTKWAVVQVTAAQEAGDYTLEDVRTQIRNQLRNQKMMDEIVRALRKRTYVDIRI